MVRVEFLIRKINLVLWRSLICGLIAILIFVISLLMSPTLSAIAQPTASPTASPTPSPSGTPKTCNVGIYLISLHDFDLAEESFSADFWLWSTCPSEDLQPLKVVDFAKSKSITTSFYNTLKREKGYWSYVKVSGTFRYDWNIRNFPFDRHTLQIILENTNALASEFIYTADKISI